MHLEISKRFLTCLSNAPLSPCARALYRLGLPFIVLLIPIVGCGGSTTPIPSAPSNFSYPQSSVTATVGVAISPEIPTITGTVTSYTISPSLPAGLSINSSTGIISGTPEVASPKASYTVTATNSAGSATASISIAVLIPAPSNLIYSQSIINATVGVAITPDTPIFTATVDRYTVSPALPAGLTINASTGVISGTPTAASPKATYSITAINSTGSATTSISIAVLIPAPSDLAYSQYFISAIVGTAIAPDAPTIQGAVARYTISPSLPAGITFNSSTGVISGIPTALSPRATYSITAINSTGSATASISIAVLTPAPSRLVYSQFFISAVVGSAIPPDIPTVNGTVTNYAISPSLPAGLTISTATGIISGTPTAASSEQVYVVNASNSTGSTTTSISITVAIPAPSSLAYLQRSITATVGTAITPDTPSVTGTVTGYSVSPSLPAGLAINSSTGVISGTPSAASSKTTYTITASNSTAATTTSISIAVAIPAPSSLAYLQRSITARVGTAIAPDTPSVTGTVTSYSVSPSLPAGLAINSSTGVISGTPSAASSKTTYTITASNSTGATTTSISIAVAIPAPSNLVYSQSSVTATVGTAITPDTPSVTGTVTGYSVSPSLPAGLAINSSTGVISGTPSAASSKTTYTITASNSAGTTTTSVSITVNTSATAILELGHGSNIVSIHVTADRALTADWMGHWNLWDYSTATIVASGDGLENAPLNSNVFDLAGEVAVITTSSSIQLYSAVDGQLVATLPAASWFKLAPDGSYVCTGSTSALSVWSPSGLLMFSRSGNYANAQIYADPNQVQVALGPAGNSVIETDTIPSGASSISPSFSGTFHSWFLDGKRFITTLSTTAWIYSNSAVQQSVMNFPAAEILNGQGDWIWFKDRITNVLQIYPIGGSTPSASYPSTSLDATIPVGSIICVLPYGTSQAMLIDLSGSSPVATGYALPLTLSYPSVFGAYSRTQWIVGNESGVLLDGASVLTTPRYFGYGVSYSIAGSNQNIAVATSIGKILLFDQTGKTTTGSIDFLSDKVMLSSDGSTLAARATQAYDQYAPDRTLNIYSLPGATLFHSFPYSVNDTSVLGDFTLSTSGQYLGLLVENLGATASRQEIGTSGSPVLWSDSIRAPLALSPDGTKIAAPSVLLDIYGGAFPVTDIYVNGNLTTGVSGYPAGWIDNNYLLIDDFTTDTFGNLIFKDSVIYDSTGKTMQTFAANKIPLMTKLNAIFPSANTVYDPDVHALYSLTDGSLIWKESTADPGGPFNSTLAGSNLVYESGHQVLIETH